MKNQKMIEVLTSVTEDERTRLLEFAVDNDMESIVRLAGLLGAQDNIGLCWAAEKGCADIVSQFIENGADVRAHDDEAMFNAKAWGNWEIAKILEKAGSGFSSFDDSE